MAGIPIPRGVNVPNSTWQAPTIPLAQKSAIKRTQSLASDGIYSGQPAGAGGAADKVNEGPEEQKWGWVYKNIWRRVTDWPTKLLIADTVLCENGAMAAWFFTASDGTVKRKNSDKLTPSTVRETFEREDAKARFQPGKERRGGG